MDWLCATATWVPTCPACEPAVSHVGRLFRTWAGLPRLGIAGPRADEKGIPRHARCEPSDTTCPISRRMDTSCCWGGDLSAVRRGKVTVVGGRVCRVPGFAQIADHLTHNSPFLPFFGEVVCTLGVCGCPMVCDRSSACDNAWPPTCPAYQPAVSHVGRLLRTLTRCSVRGRGCPVSE